MCSFSVQLVFVFRCYFILIFFWFLKLASILVIRFIFSWLVCNHKTNNSLSVPLFFAHFLFSLYLSPKFCWIINLLKNCIVGIVKARTKKKSRELSVEIKYQTHFKANFIWSLIDLSRIFFYLPEFINVFQRRNQNESWYFYCM